MFNLGHIQDYMGIEKFFTPSKTPARTLPPEKYGLEEKIKN